MSEARRSFSAPSKTNGLRDHASERSLTGMSWNGSIAAVTPDRPQPHTLDMKILVDHGAHHNLGDTSMLEGVLQALGELQPEATFYPLARPRLRTRAWDWPRVHPHPPYRLRLPLTLEGVAPFQQWLLKQLSRVGRYLFRSGTARMGFPLQFPSSIVPPERLQIDRPASAPTLAQYCEPFDALHVVGGGTITDTFAWGLIQRAALARTFAAQGKPVVMTGQQIGPFASQHSLMLTARMLRAVRYLSVREPTVSRALCRRIGVAPVEVTGDDSFGLAADVEATARLLDDYGLEPGRFIAINVRIGSYAAEHERHLQSVALLVQALTDRLRLPALVVPIAVSGKSSDVVSGFRLQEVVGGAVRVLDDDALSAGEAKGIMGSAYGAVGVSYHFCTFALSQGVPAVCIHDGAYYGQKAAGLAAFWGDARLSLALPSLDVGAATEHLLSVWADEDLRRKLSKRAERAIETWEEAFARHVVPALRGQAAGAHAARRRVAAANVGEG